jgi:hypothetical protein
MRILGLAPHIVSCSPGKAACKLRPAWQKTVYGSTFVSCNSRRAGLKVRQSETSRAFFERLYTDVNGVSNPGARATMPARRDWGAEIFAESVTFCDIV